MTDKFQCPEPSEEAVRRFNEAWNAPHLRQVDWLHTAYRVDVPQIVRSEVERAWHWWHESDPNGVMPLEASFVDYLAARFGEGEPEGTYTCQTCGKSFLEKPAERMGCLVLHPPGTCCHYGEVEVPPTERRERTFIPHMGGGQYINEFTQADRDRLDKLERFVAALAGIYEISNPGDGRVAKVKDAAREYLR